MAAGNAEVPPPIASASLSPTSSPLLALSVFDAPQSAADVPTQTVPAEFDFASFRALSVFPGPGTAGLVTIYAAKSRSNMVCIVALAARFDHLATCAFADDFPSTGLRLYWLSDYASQPTNGSEFNEPVDQ